MSRYIKADAIIKNLNCERLDACMSDRDVVDMIESAPFLEIIRCEDCCYWENYHDVMVCGLTNSMRGASDYCSWADVRVSNEKGQNR